MYHELENLGNKTEAQIAQAFAAIPAGVTSLELRDNDLGTKTGAELARAFAAIPVGVTFVDLGDNHLCAKTDAELALAFAAIPAGIRLITLSEADIATRSSETLLDLAKALPLGVSIEIIDASGASSNHEKADELSKHINKRWIKETHLAVLSVTSLPKVLVGLIYEVTTNLEPIVINSLILEKKHLK